MALQAQAAACMAGNPLVGDWEVEEEEEGLELEGGGVQGVSVKGNEDNDEKQEEEDDDDEMY